MHSLAILPYTHPDHVIASVAWQSSIQQSSKFHTAFNLWITTSHSLLVMTSGEYSLLNNNALRYSLLSAKFPTHSSIQSKTITLISFMTHNLKYINKMLFIITKSNPQSPLNTNHYFLS